MFEARDKGTRRGFVGPDVTGTIHKASGLSLSIGMLAVGWLNRGGARHGLIARRDGPASLGPVLGHPLSGRTTVSNQFVLTIAMAGTVLSLLLIGCSTTIVVRHPPSEADLSEVNETAGSRPAVITLAGERMAEDFSVTGLTIRRDETRLLRPDPIRGAPRETTVPTAALRQITVINRSRGPLQGTGVGLLAGIAAGSAIGVLAATSEPSRNGNEYLGPFAAIGAVSGALIGMLSGAVIGGASGHRTTIEFDAREPAGPCVSEGEEVRDSDGVLECKASRGDGKLRWIQKPRHQ